MFQELSGCYIFYRLFLTNQLSWLELPVRPHKVNFLFVSSTLAALSVWQKAVNKSVFNQVWSSRWRTGFFSCLNSWSKLSQSGLPWSIWDDMHFKNACSSLHFHLPIWKGQWQRLKFIRQHRTYKLVAKNKKKNSRGAAVPSAWN